MEIDSLSEGGFESHFFNSNGAFSFGKWLVEDGSQIKEGDEIYLYTDSVLARAQLARFGVQLEVPRIHKAEKSGFVDIRFSKNGLHIKDKALMYVIRKSNEFLHAKMSLTNSHDLKNKDSDIEDSCFVYLMKDMANGYFKIGISNKPEYREKTLQSEKPTIELLASKKFTIRKIAVALENSLHTAFVDKRLRGEWFRLNESEVKHITNALE